MACMKLHSTTQRGSLYFCTSKLHDIVVSGEIGYLYHNSDNVTVDPPPSLTTLRMYSGMRITICRDSLATLSYPQDGSPLGINRERGRTGTAGRSRG